MGENFLRKMCAALTVAGGLLATPAESYAIFHSRGCCGAGTTTYRVPTMAYYAPTYTAAYAPSCSTCAPTTTTYYMAAPQVVNYAPQTVFYRSYYVSAPVTAFQPVVAPSPCSSCATTTLRPVIMYRPQLQVVPVTSYSVGYASPCPTGCATASYVAPSAPSCCTPSYDSTPIVPSAPAASPTPAPALPPAGNGAESAEDVSRKVPVPEAEGSNPAKAGATSTAPRLIDPEAREAARPIQRAGYQRTVAAPATSSDGWRQSNR